MCGWRRRAWRMLSPLPSPSAAGLDEGVRGRLAVRGTGGVLVGAEAADVEAASPSTGGRRHWPLCVGHASFWCSALQYLTPLHLLHLSFACSPHTAHSVLAASPAASVACLPLLGGRAAVLAASAPPPALPASAPAIPLRPAGAPAGGALGGRRILPADDDGLQGRRGPSPP